MGIDKAKYVINKLRESAKLCFFSGMAELFTYKAYNDSVHDTLVIH